MDGTQHEQFKRQAESVKRNLNGGNVEEAMRLMVNMQLAQFEMFIEHNKKMQPIYSIYSTFGGLRKGSMWLVGLITAIGAILIGLRRILDYLMYFLK